MGRGEEIRELVWSVCSFISAALMPDRSVMLCWGRLLASIGMGPVFLWVICYLFVLMSCILRLGLSKMLREH